MSDIIFGPKIRDYFDAQKHSDFFHGEGILLDVGHLTLVKWVEVLGSKITQRSILVIPSENELEFIQVEKIYTERNFRCLIVGFLLECEFER